MIVTSTGLLKIKGLPTFVGEPIAYYLDPRLKINEHRHVAGWGAKKSFIVAKDFADRHHLQLVCLEDGFIRSLGLGKDGAQPLSIVKDTTGIYFDSRKASDLELLITSEEDVVFNTRAKNLIRDIIEYGITKYNQAYTQLNLEAFEQQQNVLVIDQTYGDQSIEAAHANASTFKVMLKQALLDHPHATIWVKTHPDVIAGRAKGHFTADDFSDSRIRVCAQNYNPLHLLSCMDYVYTVSSHMGFEALMCGKKVVCFGLPWYAGWGLTNDAYAPIPLLNGRRGIQRSLEHLFACAYLRYALYFSPVKQELCELEEIIKLLKVNIDFQKKFSSSIIGYGFSRWKRLFIRDFLSFPNTYVSFKNLFKPNKLDMIVAWGKNANKLRKLAYPKICTVEDGFIRSRGLGAHLIRPYSLVFDHVGIYYDATRPSELEDTLNTIDLSESDIKRTQELITNLIHLNITKYNVGEHSDLARPEYSRVLLVTGQVEDDLSIQLGGLDIKTNLELIKRVRAQNPDAYIIYKPHPDVHAGLRIGHINDDLALKYVNQIEIKRSIIECFSICDEIHTISSLSGFEALLRGLKVYCYGMPFYAGWGLTVDLERCPRRVKRLTLEELVHGVLIKYAMYNLPQTVPYNIALVNVEDVIKHITMEKKKGVFSPNLKSRFARLRATIIYNIKG